jgi:cytochrome P450
MAELGDSVLDVVNGISPLLALFPSLRRELGGIGPFARFVRRQRRMHEQLDALIAGAREVEPRDDVLSLLVHARDEDGEPMSDEEIRDQLLLLVAAGYETTAISLAWALYALHQPDSSEVLDRLLAELDALGPEPDPAQLHALEYLDAVCHETLRRYPLAPAPAPRRLLAPLDLMGHSLPVGTGVVTAIGIAHFREATYPDPMRFDPQRFIDGKFTPFEYLPFGGGARRCLGAALASYEMRLVLATVLRRCRLQLASLREDRGKVRGVNVGPARGVRVVVEERREGP